jgi:anti-sigma regulatory factor (Ser/Thr protein kinase)
MEIAPHQSLSLVISDPSSVGEARRSAAHLAERLSLDGKTRDNLAIVVTEAASNLLKHATTGEIVLQVSRERHLDLLALDKGPGMADPTRCLQDGFSTGGSAGIGLGAMARLSSTFDIHSAPGKGTAIFCRFSPGGRACAGVEPLDSILGGICVPKRGERLCGDAWCAAASGDRLVLMAVDGLGHGPVAADAAREAQRVFMENHALAPEAVLPLLHAALKKTRGAAVAIAEMDLVRRSIAYAGAGNISGVIAEPGGSQKSMVSHNGTVGFEMRKVQQFQYPWPEGATVILHSDGLTSHLKLDQYNGILARHPVLIAGVLYRDYTRQRDDATVVVMRQGRTGHGG